LTVYDCSCGRQRDNKWPHEPEVVGDESAEGGREEAVDQSVFFAVPEALVVECVERHEAFSHQDVAGPAVRGVVDSERDDFRRPGWLAAGNVDSCQDGTQESVNSLLVPADSGVVRTTVNNEVSELRVLGSLAFLKEVGARPGPVRVQFVLE
ncbi:uncharacterized protein LY79DRAFT_686477, partial [Colletotrichum navitas]